MIEIENLTVKFGGVKSLNELTVSSASPITGLIGPNGAGKTTLLNVMSGFVKPSAGSVRIDGDDVLRLPPYRRAAFGIRRTFQTEQVVENLSVWDNLAGVLDNVPAGDRSRNASIHAVLDHVGLAHRSRALGSELIAHDRRMVEIGRALVGKPRLVMMDEPGAGLSDAESDHLRSVILGIPDFCGAQVLLVDHDVDLIGATCAATIVLDFGSLIAHGPTSQVLTDPKVRAAYLGLADDAVA
jgi:ABC-type branched-subunit amino acid transport system ATPase component